MIFWGLVLLGIGAINVVGSVYNWDWFMDVNFLTRWPMTQLSRSARRTAYFAIGVFVCILSIVLMVFVR